MRTILAVLGKIGTLGLILIAFAFGLAGTVYLSLRSPNVTVPDITSKTFGEGESALEVAGLSIRERAKRFKSDVKPGVILDQFPRAGEVVKQGQTVAVIVSRAPKEGESVTSDEMVETEETKDAGKSEKENRPPRKPSNKNTNRNANTANGNAGNNNDNGAANEGNSNKDSNKNDNRPGNSNANSGKNTNDNRSKNANGGKNSNNRNANNTPRGSNRRPATNP